MVSGVEPLFGVICNIPICQTIAWHLEFPAPPHLSVSKISV